MRTRTSLLGLISLDVDVLDHLPHLAISVEIGLANVAIGSRPRSI
jgi:hypothetical protein